MGFIMRDLTRRWPNARIPFEIDPTLSVAQRQIVLDAVFFWNNLAGVQLTPHANEPDYVMYIADAAGQFGGLSSIGRNGGMQTIRMDYGWSEAVGALLHETGHAAGLWHEHQRPDRDQYVVAPPQSNPDMVINTTDVPIGPYNCQSVMHYYISATDPNAFRAKVPGCWSAYHGIMLSSGDIRALQALYWGCAWVSRQAPARDVGTGADGSAWIVGTTQAGHGYNISRWDGSTWKALPGAAMRISAASEVSAWCVNSQRKIYQWDEAGQGWRLRPGAAADIAMGADGSVWMVKGSSVQGGLGVYRWGNGWQLVPSTIKHPQPKTGAYATRIAAASENEAWVVTDTGHVLHWNHPGNFWQVMPNTLPDTAYDIGAGADGTIGITSPTGVVSFWSPERSSWVPIDSPPAQPGTTSTLIEIDIAPNGLPWVANADFSALQRTMAPWL
jgi:hypothetical protein